MTRARNQQISLEATPYYHTISRCVRQAFLCGEDHLTGKNYEHRKSWVVDRLKVLGEIFSIDICAYAVMSNHYHLVLRINQERAMAWTARDIGERWQRLFSLPLLVADYLQGNAQTLGEVAKAEEIIQCWRERLLDISWFMRSLNEHLARRANKEDQCKGRFWEGRFKSQALLDDAAVLTCMSYVDLNPIRASMADTPEASDFTSVQQRIRQVDAELKISQDMAADDSTVPALMPLVEAQDSHDNAMGFTLRDYLQLLDWAGRAVREGKHGFISEGMPPILQRLGLEPVRFMDHLHGLAATEEQTVLGHKERIKRVAEVLGRRFLKGGREAQRLYGATAMA